jgi:uncharacterized protein (DUF433 family)
MMAPAEPLRLVLVSAGVSQELAAAGYELLHPVRKSRGADRCPAALAEGLIVGISFAPRCTRRRDGRARSGRGRRAQGESNRHFQFRALLRTAGMRGLPCIRDTRVTVSAVLGQLAAGASIDDLLADFPYLEREDAFGALCLEDKLQQ